MRRKGRWFCVCLCLGLAVLTLQASAEISLPEDTGGQIALAQYVRRVNDNLVSAGERPVNSVFLSFETVVSMGITAEDGAEVPEQVEMTFQLYPDALNTLQLRASNPDVFAAVAAACIQAASPSSTYEDARAGVLPYVNKVKSAPENSFEDTVIEQNGPAPRTYFAYYPNQYHDQVNWMQMTLIFPLLGYEAEIAATPTPSVRVSEDEYEGIDVKDNYNHFEVFATATPEPDSPGGEALEDQKNKR